MNLIEEQACFSRKNSIPSMYRIVYLKILFILRKQQEKIYDITGENIRSDPAFGRIISGCRLYA